MKATVISGDIISSTSLTLEDRSLLETRLSVLGLDLEATFSTYSRLIKGDYLECVTLLPQGALQITLAIKCFVKSIDISQDKSYKNNQRVKFFKTHGIRLAMGFGTLDRFDKVKGIIDGDAIYRSGRLISDTSTHDKQRIVIKNTLFFSSGDDVLDLQMNTILALLDTILGNATAKQCEVLYHKFLDKNEDEIASLLGISQSAVNQHSTSVGWNSIEASVNYFKTLFPKS